MAAGKMNSDEEELVFLANAIRKTRRRRLNMQLVLRNLVARRRQVLNVALLLLLLVSQRNKNTVSRPIRSCRRLKRNTGWWDKVWNTYSEARFKKTFQVSQSAFIFILNRIEPFIVRETVTEEPIPGELRLALCLYRLGRGDYLHVYTIAEMGGLGVSTVCSIVHEVCQVLVDCLWNESVSSHMPKTREDFKKKKLDMEEFWQFFLLLGRNRWLSYSTEIPSRTGGMQGVPRLQEFLFSCIDGNGRFALCMVQFYLLPSPRRATPGTSPALRARGWGIV